MSPSTFSRREFLGTAARCGALFGGASLVSSAPFPRLATTLLAGAGADALTTEALLRTAPLARYWVSADATDATCADCHTAADRARRGVAAGATRAPHAHRAAHVKCLLCARGCVLAEGARGECGARLNRGGRLRSLVYGQPIAVHVDPIEKKPFFHFLPGSRAYSLGTAGCPLHCEFCQNWEISQSRPEDHPVGETSPRDVVAAAVAQGAPVIAFTYNEPTVFVEYVADIAREGRRHGRRSVLVSCGFMTAAPLDEMCDVLDAVKIDLKGFDPGFYRRVSRAELEPVLRSIRQVAKRGRHLEIVNLVVPTLNDGEPMLRGLCDWVVGELGPDVPLHFTRFHPDYRLLHLPPTPVETLERARDLARSRGLRYAYVGNVPGHPGAHTYCPGCGRAVIEREAFFVQSLHLRHGACAFCGTAIAGVWE